MGLLAGGDEFAGSLVSGGNALTILCIEQDFRVFGNIKADKGSVMERSGVVCCYDAGVGNGEG